MRRFNISPSRRRNKADVTGDQTNVKPSPAKKAGLNRGGFRATPSPGKLNPFKKSKRNDSMKKNAPASIDDASSLNLLRKEGTGLEDHNDSYLPSSIKSPQQESQHDEIKNETVVVGMDLGSVTDMGIDTSHHFSTIRGDDSTIGDSTIGDNTLNTYETNASDNVTLSSRRIGRLNKKKRALFKKLASRGKLNENGASTTATSTTENILAESFQMSSADTKSFVRPNLLPSRIESVSTDFSFTKEDEDNDYMNGGDPWSPNVSEDIEDDNGEPAFAPDPFANFNIEAALEEEEDEDEGDDENEKVCIITEQDEDIDGKLADDEKINTVIDISQAEDLSKPVDLEALKASSSSPTAPPPPPPQRDSKSPFVPLVGSNVRVNSCDESVMSRVSSIGNSLEDGFDEPIMHITDYMKLSESERLQAYCDLFSTAAICMKDVEDKRQEIFHMGRQVDQLYHRVVEFEAEKKTFTIKEEESQREIRKLKDAVHDRHRIDLRSVLSNRNGHSRQPSEEAMLRTELEAKDVIIEALKKSVDEWKSQDQQQERRQEREKRDDDEVEKIQKLLAEKESALRCLEIEMQRKVAEKDIKLKEQSELIEKKDAEVTKMQETINEKNNPKSVSDLNKKIMNLASGELKAVKKELYEAKRKADAYETKIAKLESERKAEIESLKDGYEKRLKANKSKSWKTTTEDDNNTSASNISQGASGGHSESVSFSAHEIPAGTVKARIAMAAARLSKHSAQSEHPQRQMQKPEHKVTHDGFVAFDSTDDNYTDVNKHSKLKGHSNGTIETEDRERLLEQLREKDRMIQKLEDEHQVNVRNLMSEKNEAEERTSMLEKELAVMEKKKETNKSKDSRNVAGNGGQFSSVGKNGSKERLDSLHNENNLLKGKIRQLDKEIEDVSGLLQETIHSIKGWNEERDDEEFMRNESSGKSVDSSWSRGKSVDSSWSRGKSVDSTKSQNQKRFVGSTQYTDEEVTQLEKLAKIHQISVIRQRGTITSLEVQLKETTSKLESLQVEAKANQEKASLLEAQFSELNNNGDKNTFSSNVTCGSDTAETSASIIKIDAAYVASLETDATKNRETITELRNKIRQLKQRNLTLRAKIVPDDELRGQLDDLRLKLQAKDLEVVELERAYMAQNNTSGKLSTNRDEKEFSHCDYEEMEADDLRNTLAKRDETVSQITSKLSKLENQSGSANPVLDLRKVSLLQEMQDAIIRRLNLLMNRIDDNREGEGENDEFKSPGMPLLISMSDKLSLLHDYQKISLHLLQSRLSNEIESLRTGSKPIKMDEDVIARFDRTQGAIEEYEKDITSQLQLFDSELKNHSIKLIAKNEVIEKLLKSDTGNRSKIDALQADLNEFKGLSVYSSVNAGVMARFKQCAELEQELEDKERVIERLNHVISEYRQNSNQ